MASDEGGEMAVQPLTNGDLHPPSTEPSVLSTPGKRKRLSSPEEKSAQEENIPALEQNDQENVDETLRYIIKILEKDDENLELFKSPLTPSSPSKPRSKRTKLSDSGDESTTIATRVAAGRYGSLHEFVEDVERAASILLEQSKPHPSLEVSDINVEIPAQIAALKKHLKSLLIQATYQKTTVVKAEPSDDQTTSSSLSKIATATASRDDKMVLTLFGNPSHPKQLFSSLQQPIKLPLDSEGKEQVDVQAPLLEHTLPNGIAATRAIPFNLAIRDDVKKPRTFGEVFSPRSTLPQLEPPRRTKSSARKGSITWVDSFEASTDFQSVLGQRKNYTYAQLPAVHWLQYGGTTSSTGYWTRRERRQSSVDNNDSSDKVGTPPDDAEALLRSAYSSFAPSYDSTACIVPSDVRNQAWWAKRGSRRFRTLVSHYSGSQQEPEEELDVLDDAALEEAVQSFEPEETPEETPQVSTNLFEVHPETESHDVDGVLNELSDLLETLNSYRQLRNFNTPTSERKTGPEGESKEKEVDLGSPSTPSAEEKAVYETLKSGLAAIVANLPPYAVAKLNGEQLAELNITGNILVEGVDYPGTMEEDDFSLQQKRIAAATSATRPTTASRPTSYQNSQTPGTPFSQRPLPPTARPQQAGAQPYYGARHSSTSTPYTPGSSTQNFPINRTQSSPTQRANSGAGYSQASPQYTPSNFQRPSQNGYNPYATQHGGTPSQSSPQGMTPRPGQPGYQQQVSYNAARSASPQKPVGYPTPQTRTPYMNPGQISTQRYLPSQQQGQQPAHYGINPAAQSPSSSVPYANSASANYARTAAEQAALMDRNKAQIAASQHRQLSSTPNPPAQPPSQQNSMKESSASPVRKQSSTPVPVISNP